MVYTPKNTVGSARNRTACVGVRRKSQRDAGAHDDARDGTELTHADRSIAVYRATNYSLIASLPSRPLSSRHRRGAAIGRHNTPRAVLWPEEGRDELRLRELIARTQLRTVSL